MSSTNGSIQVRTEALSPETMLKVVAGGDASSLSPSQKIAYYNARCEAAGLDPRAQPFAFMRLNGKEVLYALKAASDQLAAKHGIRLSIVSQATEDGIRVVTVKAAAKDGRETEEIGAVAVKGLQGEALCNALMKAVTKAKRRAVLSLAGLGMLDETEIETIPQARTVAPPVLDEPAPEDPPQDALDLAAAIQEAESAADLDALLPKIKAAPKETQDSLRPLYAAKKKELAS